MPARFSSATAYPVTDRAMFNDERLDGTAIAMHIGGAACRHAGGLACKARSGCRAQYRGM
jgi:hypothetical protein